MEYKKSIIILSGPVGAGKSTVTKELITSTKEPLISIEGDRFWVFIAKPNLEFSRNKTFLMTMTSLMAAAIPYALYGYDVLLDFSIPPSFLETALKMVNRRQVPLHYVVLNPGEAICTQRAASRQEGNIADYTPYQKLYHAFDEVAANTLNNSNSSPAEMAAAIWNGYRDGNFLLTSNS